MLTRDLFAVANLFVSHCHVHGISEGGFFLHLEAGTEVAALQKKMCLPSSYILLPRKSLQRNLFPSPRESRNICFNLRWFQRNPPGPPSLSSHHSCAEDNCITLVKSAGASCGGGDLWLWWTPTPHRTSVASSTRCRNYHLRQKRCVIIGICSFVSRITQKKLLNGFSENSAERRHVGHVKILLAIWITWLKQ